MEELCSLAALGELPLSETRELGEHIQWCAECRTLLADFAQLTLHDLPLAAASRVKEQACFSMEDADVERALTRVLDKAVRDPVEFPVRVVQPVAHSNWFTRLSRARVDALVYGLTVLLVGIAGTLGYRSYEALSRQTKTAAQQLQAENKLWRDRADSLAAQQQDTQRSLDRTRAEAEEEASHVLQQESVNAAVEDSRHALAAQLADATSALGKQNEEIQKLQASLDLEQKSGRASSARAQELEGRLKDAQSMLAELSKERVLSEAQPAVADADARALFGARNLHIVDIFDMKTVNGARKLHGRVYYVDKRLLLFYAFDLQDPQHGDSPVGFQAWGFRQPNSSQPENLGMFYLDDAAVNRWALEVKNPALLARIDTVFVTAEAPGGSHSPRGRKLLFASLAGPPNHP